jgi:predicted phage tail protein
VIEAGSSAGSSNLATFDTGSSATTFTTAAPLGTYYVRVRARSGGAVGGRSNEVVVNVTGACSAPPTPGGLTHAVNGSSVQLSWPAAEGATSYVLEAGSASGTSDLLASDIGNVTSLGATAAPGTYYVRVRARNACGSSPPSSEAVVVVTGCAPTLAPATPSASVSNRTVSVSWAALSGATAYVVEAGLSPGLTNAGTFQVSGTSMTGAAPPGRYHVRIRARNGCGVGPASPEIVIDVP